MDLVHYLLLFWLNPHYTHLVQSPHHLITPHLITQSPYHPTPHHPIIPHLITQSPHHLITPHHHPVIPHLITQSPHHLITQLPHHPTPHHPVTLSPHNSSPNHPTPHHPVISSPHTPSPSHPITQSSHHPVTHRVSDEVCYWPKYVWVCIKYTPPLAQWASMAIISTHVHAPHILATATIRWQRLFCSELLIVQLVFEGGI